jgi:hypothetical protein
MDSSCNLFEDHSFGKLSKRRGCPMPFPEEGCTNDTGFAFEPSLERMDGREGNMLATCTLFRGFSQ